MRFLFYFVSDRTQIGWTAVCLALFTLSVETSSAETQAGLMKKAAPEQQTLLPTRERVTQDQIRSGPQSSPRLEDPRSANPAPQPNELRSIRGIEQDHDPNDLGPLVKLRPGGGASNHPIRDRLISRPTIVSPDSLSDPTDPLNGDLVAPLVNFSESSEPGDHFSGGASPTAPARSPVPE
jgi:hypothetical protein